MKSFSKLFCIFLTSVLCSCDWTYYYDVTSYILEYVRVDNVSLEGNNGALNASRFFIDIYGPHVEFRSVGEDAVLYDSLCRANNDIGYSGKAGLLADLITDRIAYYPHIVSIDMFSEMDFDAEHPAGSSLGDIVSLSYCTASDYVESRYRTMDPVEYPKMRKLSEIAEKDLRLLINGRHGLYIGPAYFEKSPDNPGEYNMTIRLTLENGEVCEDTRLFRFE